MDNEQATNGDMIKAIVGNSEMTPICIGNGFCAECKYYSDETDKCNVSDWWNSPYKKEGSKEDA